MCLFLYPLPWNCTSLSVTVLTVFLRLNSCLVLYRCTSLRVTVLTVFLRLNSCLVLYRCTLLRVTVLHHYRYLVLERCVYVTSLGYDFMPLQIFCTIAMCVCHKFRLRFYAFTDMLYYSDVCLSHYKLRFYAFTDILYYSIAMYATGIFT